MFEHLPVITKDSVEVMRDKELPFFFGLLKRCREEAKTPDEAIDILCEVFAGANPSLVRGIRICAYAVAQELGRLRVVVQWQAALSAVAMFLTVLRLIDRALEAKELEEGL